MDEWGIAVPDIFAVQSTPAGKRIFSLKPDGVSIGFETQGTGVYVEDHYTFDEYAKLRTMRPDIIPAIPANGNTLGKIVGHTGTNPIPANQANPPPKPETEEEKGFWEKYGGGILDGTQLVLDGVGLIPGFGEIADGANALISLGRGDYAGAALSAAAMVPFAGWGATAAKVARRGANAVDAVNDARKAKVVVEGTAKAGQEVVNQAAKHADEATETAKKVGQDGAKVKPKSVVANESSVLRSPADLMGVEPASSELLAAVSKKRSLVIAQPGSDELRMLDYFGAEASVGGINHSSIILRQNPSKAAVLEEFLHGTQSRLGIIDKLGTSGYGSAETHVKDFMIRHQRILGLGNEDVRILQILKDKGL